MIDDAVLGGVNETGGFMVDVPQSADLLRYRKSLVNYKEVFSHFQVLPLNDSLKSECEFLSSPKQDFIT